jgi:hypothetical protein
LEITVFDYHELRELDELNKVLLIRKLVSLHPEMFFTEKNEATLYHKSLKAGLSFNIIQVLIATFSILIALTLTSGHILDVISLWYVVVGFFAIVLAIIFLVYFFAKADISQENYVLEDLNVFSCESCDGLSITYSEARALLHKMDHQEHKIKDEVLLASIYNTRKLVRFWYLKHSFSMVVGIILVLLGHTALNVNLSALLILIGLTILTFGQWALPLAMDRIIGGNWVNLTELTFVKTPENIPFYQVRNFRVRKRDLKACSLNEFKTTITTPSGNTYLADQVETVNYDTLKSVKFFEPWISESDLKEAIKKASSGSN